MVIYGIMQKVDEIINFNQRNFEDHRYLNKEIYENLNEYLL
jgi:hypothetical protein